MRQNIFDMVAEKLDMEGDTYRLIKMANEEKTLCIGRNFYYSLYEFIDEYCFRDWAYRSRYINLRDFFNALDYNKLIENSCSNIDAHLTLIELIYNLWNLAHNKFEDEKIKYNLKWCGNFYHIKDVMDEILEEYNHTVYCGEEKDYFIVIEDKAEVTAVAEIMPTIDLSFNVIKYNHIALRGNIEAKKTVLIYLASELEPKRKQLQDINKQLSENIFFMLNNLNVRHNNCNTFDPGKYKEYVANMETEILEEWYDELYQMILLAFLLLENEERSNKVSDLKKSVNGGK